MGRFAKRRPSLADEFGAAQNDCFLSGALWPGLSLLSRALLRSQGGPLAGLPFTFPTAAHSRFDAQPFRVLLLRRFWLPLLPSARNCRCGLPLDSSGHHRAVVQWQGFSKLRVGRHASAEKQSHSTFAFKTWTWLVRALSTTAVWRLWPTACLCSTEPN